MRAVISASSSGYAASTAASGVNSLGRSFSAMTMDMLHFQNDRQRAARLVFGQLRDAAHLGGFLLERLGRNAIDNLIQLAANVGEAALKFFGDFALQGRLLVVYFLGQIFAQLGACRLFRLLV